MPLVCKLKQALYGTKQAARLWHQKFREHLLAQGWKPYESDTCIFSRHTKANGHEFIGIYVDDIIHVCSNKAVHQKLHKYCNTAFPTTTQGPLHWVLGIHVTRDRASRTLCLHQTQATVAYLQEWDLLDLPPRNTPLSPTWKYGDLPPIVDPAQIKRYRSQVGSLNYFSQNTRPDIAYATGVLCRHLHNPNENSFIALKHLNSYLAHTPHLGLTYHSNSSDTLRLEEYTTASPPVTPPTLTAYSDASWGGEPEDDAKSTTGTLIYFGGALIDWTSNLQKVIAQSSSEAEHVAAFDTARTVVYYRQFLEELGLRQTSASIIHEDNTSCIAQSKNPVNTRRVRHMLLKYHYLRDIVGSGQASLQYIKSQDQIADILTKSLAHRDFARLLPHLVRPSPFTSSTPSSPTPSTTSASS